MHGNRPAILCNDRFGLHVEALSDFVCGPFAEFAFCGDVSCHLDFLAIERLKAGVGSVGWASQLDVKRTCQEECAQS